MDMNWRAHTMNTIDRTSASRYHPPPHCIPMPRYDSVHQNTHNNCCVYLNNAHRM